MTCQRSEASAAALLGDSRSSGHPRACRAIRSLSDHHGCDGNHDQHLYEGESCLIFGVPHFRRSAFESLRIEAVMISIWNKNLNLCIGSMAIHKHNGRLLVSKT